MEKNQKKKALVSVGVFVLLLAGAGILYNGLKGNVKPDGGRVLEGTASDAKPENEKEKRKAEDFTVMDQDGNEVKLSDYFGKPIVLNFWASWCGPCKSEMAEFDKVYQEMKGEVHFLMVNMVDGYQETRATGEAYVKEQGFSFPVYFDEKQEGAYTYGITSLPTTIFIDKDGNLVTGAKGAIDEVTLRTGIDMIL